MDDELEKVNRNGVVDDEVSSLSRDFWETAQAVIEDLVNEYIVEDGSTPTIQKPNTPTTEKVTLFKFEASACSLTTHSGQAVKQVILLLPNSVGYQEICRDVCGGIYNSGNCGRAGTICSVITLLDGANDLHLCLSGGI